MDIWPSGLWQDAFITLDHENGKENPLATNHNLNGSTDIGCLQTNTIHLGKYGWSSADQAYNATFNAKLAYQIYLHGGWRNWFSVEGILWWETGLTQFCSFSTWVRGMNEKATSARRVLLVATSPESGEDAKTVVVVRATTGGRHLLVRFVASLRLRYFN